MMAEKRTAQGKADKLEYIREYTKEKYDRLNLIVPKGMKEHYKAQAESRGLSISSFFTNAADEYIERH